jgi:hypothetical protein
LNLARLFKLWRTVDVSGVSGVGWIAEGMVTTVGKVLMIWYGYGAGTETYDSVDQMMYVHGHGGKTKMVYDDEQ